MTTEATHSSLLLRVLDVRVQDRNGAIFKGECITPSGEIINAGRPVVARLHAKAVAANVEPGQWWHVQGPLRSRSYVNAGGYEVTEEQIEVHPGHAVMERPSAQHIVDYLARNPRFEGIGKVTAQTLWDTFRTELVPLLDQGDYQALTDAIGPGKAKLLLQGWAEEGLSETLQWLQTHSVDLVIGRRVIAYFGASAMDKIRENPYRLLSFAAGWKEVDALCAKLGVAPHDPRRLAAACDEVVYKRFSMGDTFVPRDLLVKGFREVLGTAFEPMVQIAIEHCRQAQHVLFDSQGTAYSLGASVLENSIVDCIRARRDLSSPPSNVEAIIASYEASEGNGFKLNAEQRAAVHMAADHHFSVITGGAGCGKTTVLKAVCEVLEDQGYTILQTALAGKAVKRMLQSTGRPASTIASLIKKFKEQPSDLAGSLVPIALLIDEASMVDLISFSALIRTLHPSVKIVLIGDPDQLPPVGPGLILHCLTSGQVPHVKLLVAKRFGGAIETVANAIRDGDLPDFRNSSAVSWYQARKTEMPDMAARMYLHDPDRTVVLAATREIASHVNALVQQERSQGKTQVMYWDKEYQSNVGRQLKEGDLVICTANHWDLGLQNGSIGRITAVHPEQNVDRLGDIEWDDGITRSFSIDMLDSLELGYALTIHKSQGSQWQRVIICLPEKSRMIDRSLVYTAFTRAQAEVVLLGDKNTVREYLKGMKAADRRHVALPKRLEVAGLFAR